jgi:hypothetical protein
LALVVDPAGLDRTALWHAWDTEELERIAADQAAVASPFRRPPVTLSRCGRWSALTKLGATIRAAELDQFSAYSRREQPEFAANNIHATNHMSDRLLHSAAK